MSHAAIASASSFTRGVTLAGGIEVLAEHDSAMRARLPDHARRRRSPSRCTSIRRASPLADDGGDLLGAVHAVLQRQHERLTARRSGLMSGIAVALS